MLAVSNSSPLIYLAKGKLLFCLKEVFEKVYICEGVYQETVVAGIAKGYEDAKVIEKAVKDWIELRRVHLDLFAWLASRVGEGRLEDIRKLFKRLSKVDVETVTLAVEVGADYLLLDDRAAIKAARAIQEQTSFALLGTGDVIERALETHIISKAEYVNFLKSFGEAIAWVE